MNKKQFIDELKKRVNMPRNIVENNFDVTLSLLKEVLFKGEKIKIKNFGIFYFKQIKERLFFNPQKNSTMLCPPRKVIVFKCSKKLL